VSLTLAQKLMRHSVPSLTANVYSILELHDAWAAIEKLDGLAARKESSVDKRKRRRG
jgi:hypothetical protein